MLVLSEPLCLCLNLHVFASEDKSVVDFFDEDRIDTFEAIFHIMDVDRQNRLDLNEV